MGIVFILFFFIFCLILNILRCFLIFFKCMGGASNDKPINKQLFK